mmetsp:Transcript_19090/g.37921  ORF Transcript_19090/g.37921 Transcript_19090/m.37921 type:complete len:215 (-) Transcript_19090:947-1591(-)
MEASGDGLSTTRSPPPPSTVTVALASMMELLTTLPLVEVAESSLLTMSPEDEGSTYGDEKHPWNDRDARSGCQSGIDGPSRIKNIDSKSSFLKTPLFSTSNCPKVATRKFRASSDNIHDISAPSFSHEMAANLCSIISLASASVSMALSSPITPSISRSSSSQSTAKCKESSYPNILNIVQGVSIWYFSTKSRMRERNPGKVILLSEETLGPSS